ncbi:conserved protein, unknown function [Hepatocystis sp. ex Piliocolobus tephrosceles]|nr:conserved protein, unknown function [Hepatocystis sp. ex Piliocolobus tephrosceles]
MSGKKNAIIKSDEQKNFMFYENENEVFSSSELSDVDNSCQFWTGLEERSIVDIYEEFESSGDEREKNKLTERIDKPRQQCTIETNTLSIETETELEETNCKQIEA